MVSQNLAAEKTYNDLDVSVAEAMESRRKTLTNSDTPPKVETCTKSETLKNVIARIVKAEVRAHVTMLLCDVMRC